MSKETRRGFLNIISTALVGLGIPVWESYNASIWEAEIQEEGFGDRARAPDIIETAANGIMNVNVFDVYFEDERGGMEDIGDELAETLSDLEKLEPDVNYCQLNAGDSRLEKVVTESTLPSGLNDDSQLLRRTQELTRHETREDLIKKMDKDGAVNLFVSDFKSGLWSDERSYNPRLENKSYRNWSLIERSDANPELHNMMARSVGQKLGLDRTVYPSLGKGEYTPDVMTHGSYLEEYGSIVYRSFGKQSKSQWRNVLESFEED